MEKLPAPSEPSTSYLLELLPFFNLEDIPRYYHLHQGKKGPCEGGHKKEGSHPAPPLPLPYAFDGHHYEGLQYQEYISGVHTFVCQNQACPTCLAYVLEQRMSPKENTHGAAKTPPDSPPTLPNSPDTNEDETLRDKNGMGTEARGGSRVPLLLPTPPESPQPVEAGQSRPPIFRNEFFEVRSSARAGFGAFAVRDLRYGERILVEHPLLRTTQMKLFRDYDKLDAASKKIYLSLHGFSPKKEAHRVEKIRRANGFEVPGGFAIFAIASRFNHACRPVRNVLFWFDKERNAIVLTAAREVIPAGTELLISYGGTPDQLFRTWGFLCGCGGCQPLSEEEAKQICQETWAGNWVW